MRSKFIILCFAIFCGYAEAMCKGERDGTFLADPSSRQRFIYCWGGEMIPGYCGTNEEFNPFDRVCEVPSWNSPVQTTTPSSPRDRCFNRPDGTFLPDPSARSRFFYCFNGESMSGECQNGQVFDPVDSVCETLQETPRDPCFGKVDNTILPDSTSNRRFLYCVRGEAIPAYCPENMIFYPNELYCDYQEEATTVPAPVPSPTRAPVPTTSRAPPSPTRAPVPTPSRAPPTTSRATVPPTRATTRAPLPTRTTARVPQPTRTTPGQPTRNTPVQPTRATPGQPTRAPAQPTRPTPNRFATTPATRATRPAPARP